MPFQDTLLDPTEAEEVGSTSRLRLRVPPPHPYVKAVVPPAPPSPSTLPPPPSRSTLPPPPSPRGHYKVIPPSSPVGMLAHHLTRQIEAHMIARTRAVLLHDADVVCVEDDDNPFVPAPIFFTVAVPAPKMRSRIRRSAILPWPSALMLVAIAAGFIYEHAQRGDLRQVIESSVHSAQIASADVIARIAK